MSKERSGLRMSALARDQILEIISKHHYNEIVGWSTLKGESLMQDMAQYKIKEGIASAKRDGYRQVELYSENLTSLVNGTTNAGDCLVHGLKESSLPLSDGMLRKTELILGGKNYIFDPMRFYTICKTYQDVQERNGEIHWHIIRMTLTGLIEIQITAQKKHMRTVDVPGAKKAAHYMQCRNGIGTIEICRKNIWGEKVTVDRIFMDNVYCLYEIV